jgi:hypothetical protein
METYNTYNPQESKDIEGKKREKSGPGGSSL